jgi:Family of unknown function (DUF5681)
MPFEKGQSGNPGGRPKVVAEVRELARAHTGEAVATLVSIMTNPKCAPDRFRQATRTMFLGTVVGFGSLSFDLKRVCDP